MKTHLMIIIERLRERQSAGSLVFTDEIVEAFSEALNRGRPDAAKNASN